MKNARAGILGFPNPIRIGTATPRIGRKANPDNMRICNTCPDGASYDGSIHQLMNRGPSTIRNRPDMIVRDKATFDHVKNISLMSSTLPRVFRLVVIGATTASIAITNSIR